MEWNAERNGDDQESTRPQQPIAERRHGLAVQDMLEKIAAQHGLSLDCAQLRLNDGVGEITYDIDSRLGFQIGVNDLKTARPQWSMDQAVNMRLAYGPKMPGGRSEFEYRTVYGLVRNPPGFFDTHDG